MASDEQLSGPREIAAKLGVPLATVYQWHHKGIGPPAYRIGRHLRYRPSEVDAWVDEQAVAHRRPGAA